MRRASLGPTYRPPFPLCHQHPCLTLAHSGTISAVSGVTAYLQKPKHPPRPNQRFLRSTLAGVQHGESMGQGGVRSGPHASAKAEFPAHVM